MKIPDDESRLALAFLGALVLVSAGILGWIVVPLAGVLIDGYLLLSLGADARIIGSIWLALGVLWLAVLTRGFRQPPPKLALDSEKPD